MVLFIAFLWNKPFKCTFEKQTILRIQQTNTCIRYKKERNPDADIGVLFQSVFLLLFIQYIHLIWYYHISISAPEEIAYIHGWIDKDTLLKAAKHYGKSPYGQHLKAVAEGKLRY